MCAGTESFQLHAFKVGLIELACTIRALDCSGLRVRPSDMACWVIITRYHIIMHKPAALFIRHITVFIRNHVHSKVQHAASQT
jgi:hypothetical protein